MISNLPGSWLISFSVVLFLGCSYLSFSFLSGYGDTSRPAQDVFETNSADNVTSFLRRWLGDCAPILFSLIMTQVFNRWQYPGRTADDPTAALPSSGDTRVPDNVSASPRTTSVDPSAHDVAPPSMDPGLNLPPLPPPLPAPPTPGPVPNIIQTHRDPGPISTVSPTLGGEDALSVAHTIAETCRVMLACLSSLSVRRGYDATRRTDCCCCGSIHCCCYCYRSVDPRAASVFSLDSPGIQCDATDRLLLLRINPLLLLLLSIRKRLIE